MKTFKVEYTPLANGATCEEAIDLVNVDNPEDYCMANPDDFTVGEIVTENEFEMIECPYVDAQENYGTGEFAFKKKDTSEAELLTF